MKLGLFSVSYAGLWGQEKLTLLSFLDKAAELGFPGVLLMAKRPHLSPLDVDESSLDSIRTRLKKNRLELIGLAAYNDFLIRGPIEVPLREMQIAYIESCARICSALGGKLLRLFTGYEQPDLNYGLQWDTVVQTLKECADRAARYGVTLVVQNHHDLAVDSQAFEMLLTEVGKANVQAGYDAWSPFLRGEDLYRGARLMAPRTAMTIVADYKRINRFHYRPDLVNYSMIEPAFVRATLLGRGDVDYPAFFKGLREGGFDGWAVYEMCSPLIAGPSMENLDRHALGFLEYMKGI